MFSSIFRIIGILMLTSPILLYGQNIVGEVMALTIFLIGALILFLIFLRKSKNNIVIKQN